MNSLVIKKAVSIFTLSVFFFFGTSTLAHAQTVGTHSIDGIDIVSTPANPAPGNDVTVNLVSYSTDLNAASITWIIDGKSLSKGTGQTSIHLTAPQNGKSIQVIASIQTAEGAEIRKTVTVKSVDIDIIWETSGYTPPLYRGKTPFAYQNEIKFTAVPHFLDKNGAPIDPKTLIYKWSNGSDVLGDLSGYGKQSVTIRGSIIPRTLDINVQVTTTDQTIGGGAAVSINAVAPSLVFYQDDPLYGVLYNNSIADKFRLSHNEVKVTVAPFGFDVPAPALVYNWSVNNIEQPNLASNRSIVLRVAPGQQGISNIALTLANTGNGILQNATGAFTAIFNNTQKTNSAASF